MKRIANFALPILILAILFLLVTGNLFSPSRFVIAAQALAVTCMILARIAVEEQFCANTFPIMQTIHARPSELFRLSSNMTMSLNLH